MRGLVYMVSRDKVNVDTFDIDFQYALEKLGKSKFGFESTTVSNFKSKRHEGSGNELVLVLTIRHVGSGNEIESWAVALFIPSQTDKYQKAVTQTNCPIQINEEIFRYLAIQMDGA